MRTAYNLALLIGISNGVEANESLVQNNHLRSQSANASVPDGFKLIGDCAYGTLGDTKIELSGKGVRFLSTGDKDKEGEKAGELSARVQNLKTVKGRWFRFGIRGLAQDDFLVEKDDLYLKVEFFKDGGKNSLDSIKERIYGQLERERNDLKDEGTNKNLGLGVWRSYALEFRTPFPEVDSLRLSVGFGHGAGKGGKSEFWINEFALTPIVAPASYKPRTNANISLPPSALKSLVKIGGRWHFDPRGGSRTLPKKFDRTNADQLLYLSDRLEAPFAGNMTSWLRMGYLNLAGDEVKEDEFVPDSMSISLTDSHLVIKSKNLPNHPTAKFPDRWRYLDGNPAYIQEQKATWYLPLEPKENKDHIAMNAQNKNRALPMGPVGVAANGVIFFNPFDHIFEADATWRLDRCCGHPSPRKQYHYHKYPVCVKSPWTDDGQGHSPVIGFAFDGFPVCGPYESAGELAKDSKTDPLNEFNIHKDENRGWHYHVTPGKFPHIIGGYWGAPDSKNRKKRPR